MIKKKVIILITTFFVCMALIIGHFGYSPSNKIVAETTLASAQESLIALAEKQKALEKEVKQANADKKDKLAEKMLIEQQINHSEEELETLTVIFTELEKRLHDTENNLQNAEKEYELYYQKFKERIRYNYENGNVTYINVLLSSSNFSTFLTQMDLITEIAEYDKRFISKLQEEINFIENAKDQIVQDRKQQLLAMEKQSETKQKLEGQQKSLTSTIKDIEKDVKLLNTALEETEEEEAALTLIIQKLMDKSKSFAGGYLIWPLPAEYTKISSGYGYRTFQGKKEFHHAIDITAPKGTEIYAANTGKVIYAQWDVNGGGNRVVIDHGGNVATYYNHMTKYIVKVGDLVSRGDVIGYVGSTGRSTGNHLDFKVYLDGKSLNPLDYVSPGNKEIPKNHF